MNLHISIDCFGIAISCFSLSRIKKWMILIISVNLSTGIIFINGYFLLEIKRFQIFWQGRFQYSLCNKMSQRSLLAFGISQKRKAILSLRRQSRLQPAQKKCKTNSGSGSASNSRIFQPQWLKQFDWLEYDAETKRLFGRT